MLDLPADVQAALDAYLAARVDDATWARYVNSLGPGVALDVATVLCEGTNADNDAAAYLHWLCCEPPGDDEPDHEPLGIEPASTSYDALLGDTLSGSTATVTLSYELGHPHPWPPRAWIAEVSGDGWESEGRVTQAEWRAWVDAEPEQFPRGWAVALCRAICLSWAPEWARSAEAKGR